MEAWRIFLKNTQGRFPSQPYSGLRDSSGTSRPNSAACGDEFGVPFAPEPEEEPEPEQEPDLEAAAFALSTG